MRIQAFLLLSCVLLVWLANYRLKALFPRPGRHLLTLFVGIQIFLLLINVIMALGDTDVFPPALWDLEREWSIPSVHSTIQLLLLGTLCCMNGFAAGHSRREERAWWLVLCLAITGLAALEFDVISREIIAEFGIAEVCGGLLLLTSLAMIWRHRGDSLRRNGLLLLSGGLGLWAFGAFFLDFRFPYRYQTLEETLETLGIVIALAGAAACVQASRPQPRFPLRRFLASLCLTYMDAGLPAGRRARLGRRSVKAPSLFPADSPTWIFADIHDGVLALRNRCCQDFTAPLPHNDTRLTAARIMQGMGIPHKQGELSG